MSFPFIIFSILEFILLETYSSDIFSRFFIALITISLLLLSNVLSNLSLALQISSYSELLYKSLPSMLSAELIDKITLFPSTIDSFKFLIAISSFALSKESFNIFSIYVSVIPNEGFTSTFVTLFVEVSFALTFKIPSASI